MGLGGGSSRPPESGGTCRDGVDSTVALEARTYSIPFWLVGRRVECAAVPGTFRSSPVPTLSPLDLYAALAEVA